MSLVRLISTTACPTCGSETEAEGVRSHYGKAYVHCNGQPFEWRRFFCGVTVDWSPNHVREEVTGWCRNDPELIQRKARLKRVKEHLVETISWLDIDERDALELRRVVMEFMPNALRDVR